MNVLLKIYNYLYLNYMQRQNSFLQYVSENMRREVDILKKIVPSFAESLFNSSLSELLKDYTEIGIDSVLEDGVLKEVPIVRTILNLTKTVQNIHDRNLLKQLIKFIQTFNDGSVSDEKLIKYRKKFEENPSFANAELERIIIILNSIIDTKKSELLAVIFRAYINELINWEKFCELADVINRLFINDLLLLYAICRREINDTSQCEGYQADRLISLGLVQSTTKSMMIGSNNNSQTIFYIQPSPLGNLFFRLIN